jgi:hypothetical protein
MRRANTWLAGGCERKRTQLGCHRTKVRLWRPETEPLGVDVEVVGFDDLNGRPRDKLRNPASRDSTAALRSGVGRVLRPLDFAAAGSGDNNERGQGGYAWHIVVLSSGSCVT